MSHTAAPLPFETSFALAPGPDLANCGQTVLGSLPQLLWNDSERLVFRDELLGLRLRKLAPPTRLRVPSRFCPIPDPPANVLLVP